MLTPVVPNVTPSMFPAPFDDHEEQLVRQAIVLLEQRLFQRGPSLSHPGATRQYLQLQLAASPNEVFAAVFLDAQHRVLAFEPSLVQCLGNLLTNSAKFVRAGEAAHIAVRTTRQGDRVRPLDHVGEGAHREEGHR